MTADFEDAVRVVEKTLVGIEQLPVIPREIEAILSISTTERDRWLKDGRLPSAGTRTVKLPGRAKKITFHVFDPSMVEDLLDRDVVDTWREEDAERAAENRRKAAWKAKLTRSTKKTAAAKAEADAIEDDERFKLRGWAEFEREGPRSAIAEVPASSHAPTREHQLSHDCYWRDLRKCECVQIYSNREYC